MGPCILSTDGTIFSTRSTKLLLFNGTVHTQHGWLRWSVAREVLEDLQWDRAYSARMALAVSEVSYFVLLLQWDRAYSARMAELDHMAHTSVIYLQWDRAYSARMAKASNDSFRTEAALQWDRAYSARMA